MNRRAAYVLIALVFLAGAGTAYAGLWPVKAREALRRQLKDRIVREERLERVNQALRRRNARLLRKLARRERQLRRLHHEARRRWAPTSLAAIRLASRVTGIDEAAMRRVAFCESRWSPFAVNGRYKGLFQLGWAPFGLSPFDPYANALSAAMTVARDGSWRQWECRP